MHNILLYGVKCRNLENWIKASKIYNLNSLEIYINKKNSLLGRIIGYMHNVLEYGVKCWNLENWIKASKIYNLNSWENYIKINKSLIWYGSFPLEI